ncbi:hypothetical protein AXF42_Ash014041 [Apostasia shenzhenica]|uniref:C2 domain-containing protein n=1 Tax=Apostasia shenzhenica TaxID=1088818 RepID=A0A2I0A983_9ASPA|nr:hypothetical protein AXF42_Ash014041 [Apostasia shenzhenica]
MSPEGGGYYPSPPPFPFDFHLLEVTIISAQHLFQAARSMRTYAVAWVHPDHRLRTRLDAVGHTDPSWNDKFVFRVDDGTLRSDTSAVTVDIYASRPRYLPGSDTLLGTARAVLSTLRPSPVTRFVAVQIRRPTSLRPQGILNIGIALIDAYVRSLPLYADLGDSAFAYRESKPAKKTDSKKPAEAGQTSGDKERVLLEKKLKKWRSEIPAMEDQSRGCEKAAPATADGDGSSRRGKTGWARAISCFDLSAQNVDGIDDERSNTGRAGSEAGEGTR